MNDLPDDVDLGRVWISVAAQVWRRQPGWLERTAGRLLRSPGLARADLEVAVAALGPDGSPEREVWRLMYEQDRPVAEVAELLGVPAGTVKSRAHRARRLMRAALRRHEPVREGGGR